MSDQQQLSDLCSIWYGDSGGDLMVIFSRLLTRLATLKSPSIDAQVARLRRVRCRATNAISSERRVTVSGIQRST